MQAAKDRAAAEGLRAEVVQLKRQLETAAQSRVQQLEQTLVCILCLSVFHYSHNLLCSTEL